jgi:hypothetical protein
MTGFINKAIIINEEELRYIPKDTINADLIRLEDNSLIKVNRSQNIESLKISGKGIEIIDRILNGYPKYLETLADQQSMYEYNHISAMSEASKRSQIYSYIIQRESVFRNYLSSSNVFEINIISLTPSQDWCHLI